MKTVIAIFTALLVTTTANAGTRENIMFSPIAAEIVSVTALCPANAMCITDGTVITLSFQPSSACSEITMEYAVDEKSNVVDVTAVEKIDTKMTCIAVVPGATVETLSLPMVFPPMTLNFVGTDVSYEILPEEVNHN